MKKTIIILAISLLVLGSGTALLFAQGSVTAPPASASTATISEHESGSGTDNDNVQEEVQEGDQNAPDDGSSVED